jgi:galactose-1-phosphate uridylyltransferase
MNYANESEQFVRYSIRYQLLLAQKVAEICSANIYVFEQNDFFETETTVEMVEGIRTIVKDGHRAILSIVVKQVLKNEDQFLYFADKDVLGKDLMGLFVPKVCRSKDEVDETKETTVEEVDETKETTVEEVDEMKELKPILVANLDDVGFTDISELTDTMVKLEPYI